VGEPLVGEACMAISFRPGISAGAGRHLRWFGSVQVRR
jgi:hypothetical protein